MTFGNGLFAAISPENKLFLSRDAQNWEIVEAPETTNARRIDYANSEFMIPQYRHALVSPDAGEWTPWEHGQILAEICHSDGAYLAAGQLGDIGTSTDGESWTTRQIDPPFTPDLEDVTFQDGQFIAVGHRGLIMTSPDGGAWSRQQPFDFVTILSAAYGANIHVLTGSSGSMLTSPDALDWTLSQVPDITTIRSVTYGSGMFSSALAIKAIRARSSPPETAVSG